MKDKFLLILLSFLLLLSISCKKGSHISSDGDDYKDGTYCAEVEYYNPSTGTRNSYNLDVEVENGDLTIIHWPNGGWLDETHFTSEDITSGQCEFTSDRGNIYTVTLLEYGGCGFTDGYRIREDVNDEVVETTCPKCGFDKSYYDEYCESCKRNIEDQQQNTCSSCGLYEYAVYGGKCSSCKETDDFEF